MNKFLIVLQYELKEYLKNKAFVGMTIFLAVVGVIALCLPRFIDMSSITGTGEEKTVQEQTQEKTQEPQEDASEEIDTTMYIYDKNKLIDQSILSQCFPTTKWVEASSEEEVKKAVESMDADAGFVLSTLSSYDYYVYNSDMFDENETMFQEAVKTVTLLNYCEENNIDYADINAIYYTAPEGTENVLGKDSGDNYWYCYILVIIVFMLIIFYGQMIAVSVTNEKSNRSIEVLVTTTTPKSLLFGKVIAGAIASLCQAGVLLGAVLISYKINRGVWNNRLDMLLNIPPEVILTFVLFGLGGFLFYAFLYGAMGALVSKTEDISKSSGGLMMMIMVVYFIVLFQLYNVDGIAMKVLSFLPVSSYSAMFVRIAMGTVSMWEIIVSFIILVVSIIAAGFIGAKIYRMGTLRYGNPIKLRSALKDIRKEKH